MTPNELLRANHIHIPEAVVGHHYVTCPECSAHRKNEHKHLKCLHVTITDTGALWYCNNCSFKGPTKTNGSNGHGTANRWRTMCATPKVRHEPKFVAVYDYTDKSGELLFQVCRTADKQFPQRKPDGKGGWSWGTAGVCKVLYRLPEL